MHDILKEARAQDLLTDEESLERAQATRPDLFLEEYELDELHHHKLFALVFSQAFK